MYSYHSDDFYVASPYICREGIEGKKTTLLLMDVVKSFFS